MKEIIENKIIKSTDKIKEMLESGNIKMIPRWHFVLRGVLFGLAIIVLFAMSIFFGSFLIFKNRMLPPHAMRDLLSSLELLPWLILTLILAMAAIMSLLVSKYQFVYRRSHFMVLGIAALLVIGVSFALDTVGVHDNIKGRVDRGPVPMMRDMYHIIDRDDIDQSDTKRTKDMQMYRGMRASGTVMMIIENK